MAAVLSGVSAAVELSFLAGVARRVSCVDSALVFRARNQQGKKHHTIRKKLSKKPVLIPDLRKLLAHANHSSKGHKTPYQHESTIRRLTRIHNLSANWQH
jgi:hypothetical protein